MRTTEEISAAALEVIALVRKRTNSIGIAMRILNAAKQGLASIQVTNLLR